jgi:hypothetical protein
VVFTRSLHARNAVSDLKVVAIASNDTTGFPEDGPEGMKQTIWRAPAYQY